MTLKWEAEKRGDDFTGTIWDTSRAGGKTEAVGDNWTYIDRIRQEDYERYLVDLGADPQYLKLDPCDFGEEIQALSEAELDIMVGKSPQGGNGQGARTEGAGWGGQGQQGEPEQQSLPKTNGKGSWAESHPQDAPPPEDEDIPF